MHSKRDRSQGVTTTRPILETEMEFQGAVYDILGDVMIDRSPVIRATREEALLDARAMCEPLGCSPDVDAYVIVDGQLEY